MPSQELAEELYNLTIIQFKVGDHLRTSECKNIFPN